MKDDPATGIGDLWHAGEPAPATHREWGRRRVDAAQDILRERTFKWLATLPAELRPMITARVYPRIVNRIGDLWAHCEFTRLYLQSLLVERRKGRQGFPAEVKRELVDLDRHYFEHLSALPAMLWKAVPVAQPRIPERIFALLPQRTEIDIRAL
jgi:hypothetical protein